MKYRVFGVIALVVMTLSACGVLINDESATIVVSVAPELTARTIEPSIAMEVHHYVVTGVGPGGTGFTEEVVPPDSSLVQRSLVPGEWTITVDAYNGPTEGDPPGKKIGSGQETIQVGAGEVVGITVTVVPLSGTGTLNIGVHWPAGVLTTPTLTAMLVPADETPDPAVHTILFAEDLTVAPAVGVRYTDGALANGYYTLFLSLTDKGTDLVWGTVEAVRIIAGEPTEKDFTLVEDVNRGGLEIQIDHDLQNPVTITFNLPDEGTQVPAGTAETVIATTSEPVDSYAWYLNSAPQTTTGDTYEISDSLAAGFYTLSLVVGSDGGVLSSASLRFQVLAIEGLQGPTTDPPGGTTFAQTGDILTRSTGVNLEFSSFDLAQSDTLLWGVNLASPPGLAFDGAIDSAGETLTYELGTSDPANGMLRFTGEATIRYYNLTTGAVLSEVLPTRLTITVTDSAATRKPLQNPVVYGLTADMGGVLVVDGDFVANVLIESLRGGTWTPSVDLFDPLPTLPGDDGSVVSTFSSAFFYLP